MLSPMIILPLLITSSLATDSTPDQFRSSPYVWNASHLRFYSERKGSRITTPWTATFQLSRESTGVCYPTSGEGPQFSCSQLQSPVSLTCGGEYDFDELSGPWFSCKTWVGMPEGEERTSPRQQMLLKWRVRDVVEDKTSKTDPFQEATLEVVQAFPRPAYA